jgi:hypothetical protein
MDDAAINLPRRDNRDTVVGAWKITGCWTKLCLKYGVIGPWSHPNWSIAFDRYALSRGPKSGPPSLADFAVTLLMNSGIRTSEILALTNYLGRDDVLRQIDSLMATLIRRDGLKELSDDDVTQLGEFLDALMNQVRGVGNAKAYKGFSAWAPAHIFMLDRAVRKALTGSESGPPFFSSAELINRFRLILRAHYGTLSELGGRLSIAADLPAPISAVRVLDSLIWFDWWACQNNAEDFGDWVRPDWDGEQHKLLQAAPG